MLCTFIVSLLANKMRLRSPNMLSLILFCQPLQPYDINDLSFWPKGRLDSWVLYISTDYVFDGTKAPYQVDDKPNPLNKYGMMKYQGELAVMKANAG